MSLQSSVTAHAHHPPAIEFQHIDGADITMIRSKTRDTPDAKRELRGYRKGVYPFKT